MTISPNKPIQQLLDDFLNSGLIGYFLRQIVMIVEGLDHVSNPNPVLLVLHEAAQTSD